jgi:NTE family protein
VFNPVELDGRTLVDGAVVAGVPVTVAKQLKGDITVAVNVGFDHTQHQVNNIFDVMSKVMDIMGNKLDAEQVRHADVTITPQLGNIGTMHFQKGKECMTIGRQAAEKILPELEKRIINFLDQEDQVS